MAHGLILPPEVVRGLLAHARAGLPNEACALLGGDESSGRVTSLHLARNRLASPYRFDVEPRDLVRAVGDIEKRGEDLVAIFHSHPSAPAVPSASDVRDARYPVVHLLACLAEAGTTRAGSLRAWRITADGAREVGLRVE